MNEQQLGKEIAKLLDFSANEHMKQSTLYRLQSARRAALENYQPTLEIINSGNGTSVYGGHDPHHTGKLILLLIMLFAFALMSATYWQFLEKGRSAIDDTILTDDVPTETTPIDNEPELKDDLSIDAYIDNVRKLVDDFSTDVRVDSEPVHNDDRPTDVHIDDEPQLDDVTTDNRIDHGAERVNDLPASAPIDNEIDEWLGSNR